MKFISSTIAVIAICFATTAFSQEKSEKPDAKKSPVAPEKILQDKDTNKDGKLSLEEWKTGKKDPAKAETSFKRIDANKDGSVTLEELQARKKGGKDAKGGDGAKEGKAKKAEGTEAGKSAEPAAETES